MATDNLSAFWQSLATGRWLTEQRALIVSAMMLTMTAIAIVALVIGAHGTLDSTGRPLGTDFSNVWTAGWMADHGRAAAAWDWASHLAVQQKTHGSADVPFYGWHYPPPFLLVAAALATLPYLAALATWQVATLLPALALATRIAPGRWSWLVALGYPAVFVCLTHGHNGFLTASLLGGGMLLLDRRPWLAGLLLGCLVYKPQFALLLPIVLIAGGNWRALAGAAAAATLLIGLTLAIWGWPVWQAFLDSLPLTRAIVIEQGATGWAKIQSSFAAIRMWGGSIAVAYAVQSLTTALALSGAVLATRTMAAPIRNAVVLAAALLSTPYVLDYDLVVLGIALAFLIADGRDRGFLRWERSLYALAWTAPLIARSIAMTTLVPLGLIAIAAVFALAIRRGIVLDSAAVRIGEAFRSSPFRRSHGASGR